MAKPPIEIGIASETKAFKQGIESGVTRPLEDAADKLDELGKAKGPEQLERELGEAQKATKQLGREIERTADDIERDFRDSYRSAERSADDFHESSSENIKSFKQEAVSNLSEVASSFDGDLSSMADGVQGLTGGLASALTPGIGIPVAILGAAAGAFLAAWGQAAEDSKERVDEMYQDMLESGQAFLSEDFVNKSLADIIGDEGKVADARDKAKQLGLDVSTVLRGMAGDQASINAAVARGNELRQEELDTAYKSGQTQEIIEAQVNEVNLKWDRRLQTFTDLNGEAQKAVELTNLYRAASNEAASADQKRYEAMGRAMASVPKEITTKVKVDTSEIDNLAATLQGKRLQAYVDLVERRTGRRIP